MMTADSWRTALERGLDVALELGQEQIAAVHVAIGALETPDELTRAVLERLGLAAPALAAELRDAAPVGTSVVGVSDGPDLAYTASGRRALFGSRDQAAAMGHRVVHPLHLLLAVLRDPTAPASDRLRRAGLDDAALCTALRAEVP